MIAALIAYFMVAFFMIMGIAAFSVVRDNKQTASTRRHAFGLAIIGFTAAWGCAYIGGI